MHQSGQEYYKYLKWIWQPQAFFQIIVRTFLQDRTFQKILKENVEQ